jgi:hypothetical protein
MNLEGENGERRNVGHEQEWSWAGGRAGPTGVPDPELVEQAKRRSFSAKYKLEILAKADACTRPCEVGELLRREGLYTSGPAPVCVTAEGWLLSLILSCSSHCSQPPSGESRSCS